VLGAGELGAGEVESELPQSIFRTGSQTDEALTDPMGVSFRSSISSSADRVQVFRPGEKIWAVATDQLPRGSVVLDKTPAGYITVKASPVEIRAATVPGGSGNPLDILLRHIAEAFYRLPKK
jgi:hypothetical protein